ncbi:hypothetical protein E6Q11_05590 [Candidatus Dojkabacteria bacterium]|uniref:Uncharacterized protein n=1 Tax=Candidatus Dojkabacteria bacterium TaxID=2099670 RepID=A0A5C7J433_9BACT|nr:MAG: hypothetical protein E6Q11_05590 [Candidatus Dojkabacteria bacterium]
MMVTGSFKSAVDGGFLNIYSGAVPASANAALGSAVLLCQLSDNGLGSGLNFESTPVDGVLAKSIAQVWKGTNVATGTASFFRYVAAGDDGSVSSSAIRIQGTVGVVAADFIVASVLFTSGVDFAPGFFSVALPTL